MWVRRSRQGQCSSKKRSVTNIKPWELRICRLLFTVLFVCADKCSPGQWPKESEAKLGHLVLQAGTDQSALSQQLFISLSLPTLPFSCTHTHTHTSTHILTDRPWLCAVSAELRWPLWGSHAGGDRPDTLFHHDMLASLFLHWAEDLVSSLALCVENEFKLCELFFFQNGLGYIFKEFIVNENFDSHIYWYAAKQRSLRPSQTKCLLLVWCVFSVWNERLWIDWVAPVASTEK